LFRRLAFALFAALALAGVVLLVDLFVLRSGPPAGTLKRVPETWEIPSGFRGMIVIEFGRASCDPLPERDGRLIVSVPATGRLCTSTLPPNGIAKDEYFLVDSAGARHQLRSPDEISQLTYVHEVSATGEKSIYLYAFVGTPAEQEAARATIGVRRGGTSPSTSPP
jgi:hypothetical protein